MIRRPSSKVPTGATSIRNLPPSLRRGGSAHSAAGKNRYAAHRGYWYRHINGSINCEHLVWWMFPLLPKHFLWHDTPARLTQYIDAWYGGDRRTTARFEKDGTATEVELPDQADPDIGERIRTNATRLFAALALQDKFDVPLWGSTNFITDGRYLVPTTYINQLLAADPERFKHLNPDAKWERATEKHLLAMKLKPEQVTSGMYRGRQPAAAGAGTPISTAPSMETPAEDAAQDEAQAPPRERTIRRVDRVDYIEWVTEILPEGGNPYYCRRLYHGRAMLYEATAWSPQGPWTVYHRDNTALLALGVDP
jgi:hypothetical protein